jgi:hypothetical protein
MEDPDERFLWTLSTKEAEDDCVLRTCRCTHWLPFHAIPLLP